MNTLDLQSEIQKLLVSASESTLHDVLNLLRERHRYTDEERQQIHNLSKIMAEDRELLQKLAL